MPKVSKYGVRVSTPDMDKYLEFDVIYNSNDLFFIKVPSSYMEVFKLLSEEELKSCNSRLYLKKGHYGEENRSGKVCGKTEDEVKLNCSALFKLLNDKSVIKTDVIIVNFKKDSSDRHYSHKSSYFNDEHQKIGMSIGLKYCTKVQLGDKVTYNTYQPGYVFREGDAPYITRTEVFIDSEDVIIPDTAQNRIFLESMYIKFKSLVETIESHLSTPEAIVNLIESNQKLLA